MNEKNNKNPQDEKILFSLIRLAISDSMGGFPEIEENVIVAYVSGSATDDEKSRVRRAIISSHEFRELISDLTDQIEQADSISESEIIAKSKDIEIPSYQDFVTKMKNSDNKKSSKSIDGNVESVKSKVWITNLFSRPALASLASAALIILVYIGLSPGDNQWTVAQEEVDPGILMSFKPRSFADTVFFETASGAALAEFRNLLEFSDMQFHIPKVITRPPNLKPFLTISLDVENTNGNLIKKISADIPVTNIKEAAIQAWLLLLPSRSLHTFKINNESNQINWPMNSDSNGCVTFTYLDRNKYKAIVGFAVNKSASLFPNKIK